MSGPTMNAHRLVLAALAVFITAAAVASCTRKTSNCTPTGCTGGCCDDKDMCVIGTAATACGKAGGGQCTVCKGALVCDPDNRVCAMPGGSGGGSAGPCAVSCAGCCDGSGKCQMGTTTGACGAQGARCQSCNASQTCSMGECADPTCQGCFDSIACQTPPDNAHCGKGGSTCFDC